MAYKVIILYRLYMPPYFLGTFTEYPCFMDELVFIISGFIIRATLIRASLTAQFFYHRFCSPL